MTQAVAIRTDSTISASHAAREKLKRENLPDSFMAGRAGRLVPIMGEHAASEWQGVGTGHNE